MDNLYTMSWPIVVLLLLIFFGGLLTDQLRRSAGPQAPPAAVSRARAVALLPVDYGTLCLVFALLGDERAFRFGYAALAVAYGLFCLVFSVRWFRALSALNASSAPRS